MDFKRIAVFGLGLLGGSICRDIKKISGDIKIIAYGRDIEKISKAVAEGNIDYCGDINKPDLKDIDLIIVSLPVVSSISMINDLLKNPSLEEKAVIIDVGSIKASVINNVEKNRRAASFIGCHPMAGSEKTGYENSKERLFESSSVIITPNKFNRKEDIEKIRHFWEDLRARTIIVSADIHDSLVAFTSHIPHLTACIIVDILNDLILDDSFNNLFNSKEVKYFIGSGFRDVTRIASGSPHMWADVFLLNKGNISASLTKLIEKLQVLKGILDSDAIDVRELFIFFEKIRNYKLALDCE